MIEPGVIIDAGSQNQINNYRWYELYRTSAYHLMPQYYYLEEKAIIV